MRSPAVAAVLLPFALAACLHSSADDPGTTVKPVRNQVREEAIAFASRRDGDNDVFVVGPDGRGLRRLTTNASTATFGAEDAAPAWSPDGRLIAFVSTRDRVGRFPSYEVYVMDADGGDQRRLTKNTIEESGPAWLPDGRIVFVTCPESHDKPPECALIAVRPDGSQRDELADLGGLVYEADPSPDGTKIAFSMFEGQSHFQHFELFVADIDGGDRHQLTENEAGDGSPAWSPDGRRIAFISNRAPSARCFGHDCAGFTTELYVMDADGSNVTRLTRTPHEESSPDWSPDGTKIAYSRQLDDDAPSELYLANADGSCPSKLLADTSAKVPDWYGPTDLASQALDC
jgi:Tol biopolymer transport system component